MLTIETIKQIAARASQTAAEFSCPMSIAIVDSGANLAYLERMDDAMIGSAETALRKARSAVLFKRPTKAFQEMLAEGRTAILSLPGAMPIGGGVPLLVNGKIAGGIGISGGNPQQDTLVAETAAEFFAAMGAEMVTKETA
jgi:glc operon protein GlcG